MKKRLTIIDIGSHKLEELCLLLRPGKSQYLVYAWWIALHILRALRRMNLRGLRDLKQQLEVVKVYFLSSRSYNIQIISIEPNTDVAYKYVRKLRRKYPIHYIPVAILGHDSRANIELKKLYFYGHTRSSSIYLKNRPLDNRKSSVCVGFKFSLLWDQLIKENIITKEDAFILRVNCEGSEFGVVQECKDKNLKPLCIIGSLGDALKIHGPEADLKMMQVLKEMNVPYYYFKGEDPSTWFEMIKVWDTYTREFRTGG